ncbi:putative ribonuclease H-like domain-containing protein [Tanacetum coccineum]
MCDKKNSVLFTDTGCFVLSPDFKLADESQVLLKVPRKNNMYSVDMKNIVPKESLTCLVAKATLDESMLWHRRLGHVNFKTINKLVKENLVRGLPTKRFENDQTCVACLKGKQHKASFMSEFCEEKGIKKEFSTARTPQQNGVAERRNMTLTEAARTMLADSKLPTTFWAEAVNTACYVQNRVLVVKPHNKTPYELFRGRTPALSFMRPFGCHVTILNTLDYLGKFDGKSDEGFFVGYLMNSKAFRVYNIRTRKVEEKLHIRFLEDKPIIASDGPKWLFDIDVLTKSMNYVPVVAGTNSNDLVGTEESIGAVTTAPLEATHADFFGNETEMDMSNITTTYPIPSTLNTRIHNDHLLDHVIGDVQFGVQTRRMTKTTNEQGFIRRAQKGNPSIKRSKLDRTSISHGKRAIGTKWVYKNKKDEIRNKARLVAQMDVKSAFLYGKIEEEVYVCQPSGFEDPEFLDRVYKVEKALYGLHQAPRACDIILVQVYVDDIIFGSTKKELCTEFEKLMHKKFQMSSMGELTFFLGLQVTQKDDGIFISQDKYVDEILKKFGFSTLKITSTPMETSKTLMKDENAKDVDVHLYRSMIGSLMYLTSSRPDIMFVVCACARFQVTPKVSHLHAVKRIFRYLKGQPKLGLWYPKDSLFNLEAYTDSDYAGAIKNPVFHSKTKHIEIRHYFIRDSNEKKLIQMIKIHTDQNVADLLTKAFNNGTTTNDEIQVSDVGLTYYCDSVRKRIERYSENKTERELVRIKIDDGNAFWNEIRVNAGDSVNAARHTLTTASVKTVNGEVHTQALVDGKKVIVTETSMRRALQLKDVEGTECLLNATIFKQLTLMRYENLTQKLTFYKAFFSPLWKILIHTILKCISAKITAWNEFSSTMASAVICLATNQKFKFSKYIFDNMVKNLEVGVKFLMYLRFVQVFLDKQVEGMTKHKEIYVTPSHTKKVFANMKRGEKCFSGRVTPLFQTMMVQALEELGEGSEIPTDPQHTPTIIQPSTSQPQKKQPRRKQRKDIEVPQPSGSIEPITDEAANEEHVPTHSNDPLFSGEDRLQLKELVKKLERRNKSRTLGLKRLRKVGRSAQVVSSEDEGLGAQEDAFKQGRKIANLDADAEEVEVEKAVSTAEVTTVSATTTIVDELTLAQTLIEIKAAKPKAVTTDATTTTTAVTRPKARGVVVQEPSEFRTTTSSSQTSQLPQAKDKGKAKMIEPEKPLKKKDQILIDEEIAQKLQAQLNAELEEEEKLAKQREEDANIAEWDNVQAMIDADYELAARLQAQEQEELTVEEKSKLFVELMDKRKKHFARLRAEEQRRKPPTKAQKRNQMCTYLKNMAGFTHNSFVSMDSEVVKGGKEKDEGSVTRAEESSSKRAGTELEQERIKKQKIDDDQEEAEMKKHMEIVVDEEEIAVDAIPLSTKPPIIIDWKIIKEGKMGYF